MVVSETYTSELLNLREVVLDGLGVLMLEISIELCTSVQHPG